MRTIMKVSKWIQERQKGGVVIRCDVATIDFVVAEFMTEQKLRGNTVKTMQYYEAVFKKFRVFTDCELVTDISLPLCKRYTLYLMECGINSVSVQSYLRGFRAFLSWLYISGYISENLSEEFRLPKAHKAVINVLTVTEIELLLSQFDDTFLGRRNRCICLLMLDSGLRSGEAVSLASDRVHLDERYVIVDGKCNKERIVPLSVGTVEALQRYSEVKPKSDFFFCSAQGKTITTETIKDFFKELKRVEGLERIYPHLLRHTFATMYLENGGNIYNLQSILGHTTLEMVKRYLHMTRYAVLQDFDSLHPCVRLNVL